MLALEFRLEDCNITNFFGTHSVMDFAVYESHLRKEAFAASRIGHDSKNADGEFNKLVLTLVFPSIQ
jgi:hypothetical protein